MTLGAVSLSSDSISASSFPTAPKNSEPKIR